MNISHYRTVKTVNIHMTEKEATLLSRWLEETTNPAPDQTRDALGRLEDMLNEIITSRESKYL